MRVGGDDGIFGIRRVVAEDCQRGVAIAANHVAQDLIVRAVFTDDHEHVLDLRRIADLFGDCARLGPRIPAGGTKDILKQVPVVVLVDLIRHCPKHRALWHRNDTGGAKVLVRVEGVYAVIFSVRIFGSIRRRGRHVEARGAEALVVGNEQRVVRRVQHNRARRIADWDHADHAIPATPALVAPAVAIFVTAEVDYGDRIRVVERNVGEFLGGVDGNGVRTRAIGWLPFAGHADRQPEVDLPQFSVTGSVDHGKAVAISVGNQEILAPESHAGRVQAGLNLAANCKRGQVDHGNGAGGSGAGRILGDDRGAVGVFLEVFCGGNPAGLVGDIGGLAVRRNHHAVRHIADADLRNLRRGRRGQVDLGQRIVVIKHDVGSLAIRRDGNAGRIGGQYRIGEHRDAKAAWDIEAAVSPPRAVREASDVVQIALGVDGHRNGYLGIV